MILNISLKSNSKSFSMLQQYLVLLGKVLQHSALVKQILKGNLFYVAACSSNTSGFYNQVKLNASTFDLQYLYVGNWRFQILHNYSHFRFGCWHLETEQFSQAHVREVSARQGQTQDSNLLLSCVNLLEESLFLKRKAAQSVFCATSSVIEKST